MGTQIYVTAISVAILNDSCGVIQLLLFIIFFADHHVCDWRVKPLNICVEAERTTSVAMLIRGVTGASYMYACIRCILIILLLALLRGYSSVVHSTYVYLRYF